MFFSTKGDVLTRDLKGKWVLVTGAASGIGRELCLILSKEGCNLILADINEDGARNLASEIEVIGVDVHFKKTDVADIEQINALKEFVSEKAGSLDVLVNCAGVGRSSALLDTTAAQWESIMRINFHSAVNMTEAFVPSLKKTGGQIVNISSGLVFFPAPTWGVYATTKSALASFSECLSWELKGLGIAVTTVFPGVINTPFYSELKAETAPEKLVVWLINKFGTEPEKIAWLIAQGIKKRKRRVMHSWINRTTYLGRRLLPCAFDLLGEAIAGALQKK